LSGSDFTADQWIEIAASEVRGDQTHVAMLESNPHAWIGALTALKRDLESQFAERGAQWTIANSGPPWPTEHEQRDYWKFRKNAARYTRMVEARIAYAKTVVGSQRKAGSGEAWQKKVNRRIDRIESILEITHDDDARRGFNDRLAIIEQHLGLQPLP